MKITLVILALSMMLCCSKKDDNNAKAKVMYDESMKMHDQLMPRMAEMYSLEGKLQSLRDTLLLDSSGNDRKIILLNAKLRALEQASKAMLDLGQF